jgi:hypothetical protein
MTKTESDYFFFLTENQAQNGRRIHEKSKKTNTKVETSDSCFG